MRAVRANGQVVETVEVPAPEGDGLRVRVRSAGICGSDLLMLQRGFLQHTIGHEFAGLLDDDTPVAVQPTTPCGACKQCERGDYQLCPATLASTLGVYGDGGMAEEVRVDPSCIVPLPTTLPVADACLVEPVAVSIHGMQKAGLEAGMRVGIVGSGTIGLCAGAIARHHGCDADVVARHAAQKEAAETLGLGRQLDGTYDMVIDAAGNESALATAVQHAEPGAELLLLGFDWERVVLPGAAIAAKELVIRATMTYGHSSLTRDVDAAASLLGQHPEIASALITHRFGLDDAARAFETASERAHGAIKVVLEP